MPTTWIVVNCGSRGDRDSVKFYAVPAVLTHRFQTQKDEFSKKRRALWIASIKRDDLMDSILKNQEVYSSHFITGPNTKTTIAILNCLLARQLCFEDASCSAILEIIPRVCGPEVVACSTVTVTKCQAALRTLQAFPFFKPTCLCREPHVDPECNSFRDFLFDHPCVFVMKKEKDPYPVDALPTCTHAHFVCQQEHKCIKLYEEFKANCKVRDSKCRMDDRDLCYKSWTNLRLSPMFGCICPNNHMKKRCDRIFSMVNHNPCVDSGTGTGTAAITSTKTSIASTTSIDPLVDDNSLLHLKPFSVYDGAAKITASENSSAHYGDEIGNSLLSNPLVDSVNGEDAYVDYNHISVNVLKNKDKSIHFHAERQYPEEDEEVHHTAGFGQSSSRHHAEPSYHVDTEKEKVVFQSTCHLAMANCNNNYQCRMLLAPIVHHCDVSHCNRNSCMEALQTFYGKPDFHWNVEIAFCLCKKTDNKNDPCLIAQEKLHPVCAQRMEETPQPTCLHLAEICRENKECRNKLEYFEQSCAVDSVTKKCAGSPSDCRKSILAILGTDLRTTCACRGTDMAQLYECLGWQRLLWVNPCVVEAQKQFHIQRAKKEQTTTTTATVHSFFQKTSINPTSSSTTTTSTTTIAPRTTVHVVTPASKSVTEASVKIITTMAEFMPPPQAFVPTSTHISFIPVTNVNRVTTVKTKKTTTVTTSTAPPRSCVVQRPQFSDQFIREGTLKRIYHEDEFECSDVCECEIGEKLSCRTMCIDRMPCKTEFAFYNHAAPAYQAFRGRCLCYSGRFICVKPSPVDYTLPQGIYLFLGYSEVDEKEINKNQSAIVIQDVIRVLQSFIRKEAVNGTYCNLELYNSTKENIIIQAKLSEEVYDYSKLSPKEILAKEKDECAELLELISDKINSRDSEFVSHLLLSVFKMAEVEIVQIEPVSSSQRYKSSTRLSLFLTLVIFIVHITQNFRISS